MRKSCVPNRRHTLSVLIGDAMLDYEPDGQRIQFDRLLEKSGRSKELFNPASQGLDGIG